MRFKKYSKITNWSVAELRRRRPPLGGGARTRVPIHGGLLEGVP